MTSSDSLIAVVAPDPSERRTLGRLLASAGWFCVAFPDLDALLASPLSALADCLVVSLESPGLTASDVERRLGAQARPLFLYGGGGRATKVREGRGGQPVAHLGMPFDLGDLLCLIRTLLTCRDLRRAAADSPRADEGLAQGR